MICYFVAYSMICYFVTACYFVTGWWMTDKLIYCMLGWPWGQIKPPTLTPCLGTGKKRNNQEHMVGTLYLKQVHHVICLFSFANYYVTVWIIVWVYLWVYWKDHTCCGPKSVMLTDSGSMIGRYMYVSFQDNCCLDAEPNFMKTQWRSVLTTLPASNCLDHTFITLSGLTCSTV